tara:strand:+ start:601 stop:867 length:267 start_codon:yes stop_codon:yes gene_type:complete
MKVSDDLFRDDRRMVEYRVVSDENLPPIVITMTEDDDVKVVMNQHHKIWLCLNRKEIAGCAQSLFEKIDMVLTAFLSEQREYERMDNE